MFLLLLKRKTYNKIPGNVYFCTHIHYVIVFATSLGDTFFNICDSICLKQIERFKFKFILYKFFAIHSKVLVMPNKGGIS